MNFFSQFKKNSRAILHFCLTDNSNKDILNKRSQIADATFWLNALDQDCCGS